jgi:hypothetical protein
MVPLAGIEPALLAELDFESSASTNSATGAFETLAGRRGSRSRRNIAGIASGSTRSPACPKGAECRLSEWLRRGRVSPVNLNGRRD